MRTSSLISPLSFFVYKSVSFCLCATWHCMHVLCKLTDFFTHSLNNSYLHAIWRESWHSNHTTVMSLECRVWVAQGGTDQSSSLSLNETCWVSQKLKDKTNISKVCNNGGSGVQN
jgi:hypothetical protein